MKVIAQFNWLLYDGTQGMVFIKVHLV